MAKLRKNRAVPPPKNNVETGEEEFLENQDIIDPDTGADNPSGDDDALTDAVDALQSLEVSARARAWIARKNLENQEVTATLYKWNGDHESQGKKQCMKWVNDFPDDHQIGLLFGGGRYTLIITYPKGFKTAAGVNKFNFALHDHYNRLKREEELSGVSSPYAAQGRFPAYPVQTLQTTPSDPLAGIERMLALLLPLLKSQTQNGPGEMLQMYQVMGQVMKKSLMDQTDFYRDMQDRMLPAPGDDMDPENPQSITGEPSMPETAIPPAPSMWERLLPLAMPILEKILSGNDAQSAAAVATVQAIPQVANALHDARYKQDAKNMIAALDSSMEKSKVDVILKKLKVERGIYD